MIYGSLIDSVLNSIINYLIVLLICMFAVVPLVCHKYIDSIFYIYVITVGLTLVVINCIIPC